MTKEVRHVHEDPRMSIFTKVGIVFAILALAAFAVYILGVM